MQLPTFVLVTDMAVGVCECVWIHAYGSWWTWNGVKNNKISGSWCGLYVIAKHIYKEVECKVIAMTLIAQEFGSIRI